MPLFMGNNLERVTEIAIGREEIKDIIGHFQQNKIVKSGVIGPNRSLAIYQFYSAENARLKD